MESGMTVGSLTAVLNYFSHKRRWLTGVAFAGLTLIYLSNSHGGFILSRLPRGWMHQLHHGLLHRLVNIGGCSMLLGSNYFGHRFHCKDNCCTNYVYV
mmetsp:Transcript_23982/g.55945  ORF Transcript_23982/g.55945 Transcript_23982/m.55945 type:complete len:98 (+) Transcript_23982:595-888(+)